MDHVVDRHLADQPVVLVDHGGADEVVFLEHQADLFLVEHDGNQGLVALHHICQRDRTRRAHDP